MTLTFGQYNTLAAMRRQTTFDQLLPRTGFGHDLVNGYIEFLFANGLINLIDRGDHIGYTITDTGRTSLVEYEIANPELAIKRDSNIAYVSEMVFRSKDI
jgi:predicted transcriptional regulator